MTARRLEARPSAWEEIQSVMDGLDEQAAFIDRQGTILAVNNHWRREVERQARHGLTISRDYNAFLAGLVADGDEGARPILEAFRDICAGNRNSFSCLYRGVGTFDGFDFKVIITALHVHDERHVLVTVHDVTELVSLKRQRRRLGSQLLHAQEAERRRLARDLHDSTAQALVALQLSLHRLTGIANGVGAQDVVAECQEAIQEVHREIRALSFIAHPPSPTVLGLQNALENLATGFAKRAGFQIHVECFGIGEASTSVEAAIFRLTQEALANIHRHASATHAMVRLVGREHHLHLLIADDGVGFDWSPGKASQPIGVGVLGMTERVHELGGRLSMMRREKGTLLRASLPRKKADVVEN